MGIKVGFTSKMELFYFLLLACAAAHVGSGEWDFTGNDPRSNIPAGNEVSLDPSERGEDFNKMVDFLIQVLQDTLRRSNHTTIQLPDVEEQFIKRIEHIKIKGKVTAQRGWLKDLSSLHRVGDATKTETGGNMTISLGIGLAVLDLGYDYLRLKVEGVGVSGNVSAEIGTNSVFVKVHIEKFNDGKCNVTLQEFKITQLDGLRVHVEGLKKPWDWLTSTVVTIITNRMKSDIIQEIQNHVTQAVQQILEKIHC